jgi:putative phosphotransacetylase
MKIPVEISARHIHLSQADLEKLFTSGYELSVQKPLSQPNQFAANEVLTIVNNDKKIENIRILGPVRTETQVEISKTDAIKLAIDVPLKISGDLKNTPGIKIISPKGEINLISGVIIAKRHLHISPIDAKKINVKDGDEISVSIGGERSVIFNNVIVRSRENIDELALHLDTDEANAANVNQNSTGEIV